MDAVVLSNLVKKAKNRDLQAFEKLVEAYQKRVFALCVQLTGNQDDAQDLAQEVFIQAFASITNFRQESDLGTWLHRIAVNKWINITRKQKKAQLVYLDAPVKTGDGEAQREVAATEGNPQELVEEKEFHARVRRALGRLTYEHRAVLVLREIQGYSYEEIAGILDCSVGTVRSRLNRARKAMKDNLQNLSENDEI
ncbi:MAG: sigma-70 family RNA polymerase sigma factor [Bacillota bacterium]